MLAALRCSVLVWCLTHCVWSQGPAQLLFSSNPVYSGDPVTLTFTYALGFQLSQLIVEALNGKLQKGFLICTLMTGNCNGTGIFAGKSPNRWPNVAFTSSVNMTLVATPSHELDYNGTLRVGDGSNYYSLTFGPSFLQVHVCPTTPIVQPSPVAFYDGDNGVIICESRNGRPAANVSLTVSDSRRITSSRNGNESAVIELTSPLSNWYNATATCVVTNHYCSNMTVTTGVFIRFNTTVPDEVCTNESKVVMNCSRQIWSYPGFLYKWTVPAEASITENLDRESLTVLQGQSGPFICTATNSYSMASVVIVFTASNMCHPMITTPIVIVDAPSWELCWIFGLVLGVITLIIIAVVFGVLCKRGHFLRRSKSTPGLEMHCPDVCATERSNVTKHLSVDREYDSLDSQKSSEPTYSQLTLEQSSSSTTMYENVTSSKR